MVVVCPPPSLFMARPPASYSDSDDDDESSGGSYYVLEAFQDPPGSSGDFVIEVFDDDDDDDEDTGSGEESVDDEANDEPCWDPLRHADELPLRPMSRFRRACIDVTFVVGTVAMEAGFVGTIARQDDAIANRIITLVLMLPFLIGFLYLAALMHLMATRSFDGVVPPNGSSKRTPK